jgi:hypothetical protein
MPDNVQKTEVRTYSHEGLAYKIADLIRGKEK